MVTASFATFPPRFNMAVRTMHQLSPQVDRLKIYVNDMQGGERHAVPWRDRCHANVEVRLASETRGDLGDAGKFYAAPTEGIHLTCDDDLLYPDDYVSRIIEGLNRYDGEQVVGFHGCDIAPTPVESYYDGGQTRKSHFVAHCEHDRSVHLLGTGCMAYRPDVIRFPISLFTFQNMADIFVAQRCQRKGVGMVVLAHERGWLTPSNTPDPGIYETYNGDDPVQTELINEIDDWTHPNPID